MLWAVCHSSSCSSALPPCPTDLLLCVLCCSHAFTLVRASTDVFSFVLCCCPLIQCYVTVMIFQVDACGRPPLPVICFGFLLVPSVSFHESGRPRRQYQAPQGVDKHSAMQLDGVGKSRGACAHDLGGACPLFCDRVPVILGSVCPLFWKRVPVILGACARYFESVCPLFLGVCPLFSDVCPLK